MDKNTKKAINLFKAWILLNHPELHLEDLFKEFEDDYLDFKELIDGFINFVMEKIDSEVIKN